MIKITDKAANAIRKLLEQGKTPKANLRIKVIGAGCSGYSYKLDFDEASPAVNEKTFESNGVSIVIDSKSILFLSGMELDFTDGLTGQGFVFNNPNAKRTCGCGSSFSV